MKLPQGNLKNKISFINAISKVLIIIIAVSLVPRLANRITIGEIDNQLIAKLDQVYQLIEEVGIREFTSRDGENQAFGSYNILKEEYISIEAVGDTSLYESIDYTVREIENEVIEYRVISATIETAGAYYLIEIGKSTGNIRKFEILIRKFTFYSLLVLLIVTILLDLLFTQFLLRPFGKIIEKLKRSDHPRNFDYTPVRTTTTDFKYLEENIHGLMRKIESAFNEEREYISNISHELLTPISIIRTKLENFSNTTSLTDEEMAKIIESKVTLGRLTKMVRTLLLMSRIDNEEYLLKDLVDLKELIREIAEDFSEHFEQKAIRFTFVPAEEALAVTANRELMHILIFNLLNNAIKYTPEGGAIQVSLTQSASGPECVIADNGIGIREEDLPHIFDRFKKFQDGENNFGLGLALVKKIADYHRFTIRVESKPGEGTRFVIAC